MLNVPATCPRCGGPMGCHSVSYFNTEDICCDCKTDERQFPGYAAALAAEEAAVRGGDLNFRGVGLSELDRQVMQQLLAEHRKQARMPKQSAGAALRERHTISSAKSDQVARMLRAALQILDSSAGFNIGELAGRSGYSRQSVLVVFGWGIVSLMRS